jgi:hypothetical protein
MHFAHVIQRKGRVLAVLLTLAIMGMLIAAVVFFCLADHQNRLKWTTCIACPINRFPEAHTVNEDRDCPLRTKRLVVGQITICRGCCCGNVEHGLPEVPVEWLKSEWRKRGLLKRVQLTISGCVGPCDVPNVVVITTSSGTVWLGNIVKFDQYRSLLEWAVRCRDAGEMLTLPREFHECKMNPFRS